MSGELRDTPIDLWNTLYLLFPIVYTKREESSQDKEVEVEGTPEYAETREKLLKIITGFSFQRPGSPNNSSLDGVNSGNVNETKLAVPLNSNKRKLYDDYLTQTLSQVSFGYYPISLRFLLMFFFIRTIAPETSVWFAGLFKVSGRSVTSWWRPSPPPVPPPCRTGVSWTGPRLGSGPISPTPTNPWRTSPWTRSTLCSSVRK